MRTCTFGASSSDSSSSDEESSELLSAAFTGACSPRSNGSQVLPGSSAHVAVAASAHSIEQQHEAPQQFTFLVSAFTAF
jgi:hypothetical protein